MTAEIQTRFDYNNPIIDPFDQQARFRMAV
jgi:hypothetical protein